MKRNLINKTVSTLLTGIVITASGLILETPAYAGEIGWNKYGNADMWYYYDEHYDRVKGWQQIDGEWYYFDKDGILQTNQEIDGYWVNEKGMWVKYATEETKQASQVSNNTNQTKANNTKQVKTIVVQEAIDPIISYDEYTRIAQEEMLRLVNEHREENGVQPLEWNDTLAKMATEKSEHMAKHHYVGHDYKGMDTGTIQQIMWEVNTSGENCLGNISIGKITEKGAKNAAKIMFNQWKNSTRHNKIMLNPDNRKIGFSFAQDENGYTYATQIFAWNDIYNQYEHAYDEWTIRSLDQLDKLDVPEDLNCGGGEFHKINH